MANAQFSRPTTDRVRMPVLALSAWNRSRSSGASRTLGSCNKAWLVGDSPNTLTSLRFVSIAETPPAQIWRFDRELLIGRHNDDSVFRPLDIQHPPRLNQK